MVSDLAGLLSAYDTTALLLGEYTNEDIQRYPEFAVSDSIIQLARQPLGTRDERYLRVLKLRGSSYREGQHAFRITDDGIELYPRLVSPRIATDVRPALRPHLARGAGARRHARRRRLGRHDDAARRAHGLRQDDGRDALRARGSRPQGADAVRQLPGESRAARAVLHESRRRPGRREERRARAHVRLARGAADRQHRRRDLRAHQGRNDPSRGDRRRGRSHHGRERHAAPARLSLFARAALRGERRHQPAHLRVGNLGLGKTGYATSSASATCPTTCSRSRSVATSARVARFA